VQRKRKGRSMLPRIHTLRLYNKPQRKIPHNRFAISSNAFLQGASGMASRSTRSHLYFGNHIRQNQPHCWADCRLSGGSLHVPRRLAQEARDDWLLYSHATCPSGLMARDFKQRPHVADIPVIWMSLLDGYHQVMGRKRA
jgi:hypothetical protein